MAICLWKGYLLVLLPCVGYCRIGGGLTSQVRAEGVQQTVSTGLRAVFPLFDVAIRGAASSLSSFLWI